MVQRSYLGGAPSLSYELWYTSHSIIGDVRYHKAAVVRADEFMNASSPTHEEYEGSNCKKRKYDK